MEFGFGIPTRGPMATPESIAALARQGEALGFAIISVSDHIVIPKTIASTYPYNDSGTFAGGPSGECLEQLSLLSFLVGVTSSAKLLTSVMVLPHRPPVLTARAPHGRLRRRLDA
jgi:alkanesulfonate monooxygenase SsuD/methylene tetrahydromethanopterin reductase-like flavin-dependent oxidoreductase (luciferase family)